MRQLKSYSRFLILLLLLALPMTLRAFDIDGLMYSVNTDEMTAEVTGLTNTSIKNLIIPDKIDYNGAPVPVTSIRSRAFRYCSGLTSVTIGNSVTEIGQYAFSGCSGLASVTIPNSVTSIGESAFYQCDGLTSVTIPNSVTEISSRTFYGCSGLTSVTIGNFVIKIGSEAFRYCSGLTSVTIPNSVTSIGSEAFYDCSGLTSVTIPNSVTEIGSKTFCYCSGLTSVTIGNSVTSIGESAFYQCDGLKEVTIADGTENLSFGEGVFYNDNIETLYLGRNFTCTESSSSYYPFYGKTSLTKLTIGNSVTSIGQYAFSGCPIESISSRASVAPAIYLNSFSASAKYNGQVSIPDGALDSYQKEWWMFKQFRTDVAAEDTYTVSSPGNLINQLPLDKVEQIASLKLIGKINQYFGYFFNY